VEIGAIGGGITGPSDGWLLDFTFNNAATAARVEKLLRAVTYTNVSADAALHTQHNLEVSVVAKNRYAAEAIISVTIAPANTLVLTKDLDNLVGGNEDNIFSAQAATLNPMDTLNGGGGSDTLQLLGSDVQVSGQNIFDLSHSQITSIETLKGTAADDTIWIHSDQLQSFNVIDAGSHGQAGDNLMIEGTSVDLHGKALYGVEKINVVSDDAVITLDDKALTQIIWGRGSNDHLILNKGTLTAAERKTLHDQGLDKITDESGVVTTNSTPRLFEINGDHIQISPGGTALIDAGGNAILADDDSTLFSLELLAWNDMGTEGYFGIRTEGGVIELSNGLTPGSIVSVHGVAIGTLWVTDQSFYLGVSFNENATPARVQKLLRAVTYTNSSQDPNLSASDTVEIYISDKGGRTAEAFVFVSIAPAPNSSPTQIALSAASVSELAATGTHIGDFTAQDPNAGDVFTYKLLDDAEGRFAVEGNKLVVANGMKLDFEQRQSFQIKVQVTDRGGLSLEESFTISVQDVAVEITSGSSQDDIIVGGSGNDTLNGGAGADVMTGGMGNDVYHVDNAGDVVTELPNQGRDSVFTSVSFSLGGNEVETLTATGSAAINLTGSAHANTLTGNAGNNIIMGEAGEDRLSGGLGQDTLYGNAGRDTFVFDDGETGSSKSRADTIMDFSGRGGDKIDLRAIDANTKKSGDQNFSFIGTKAFTKAGEVRYEKVKKDTYVYLNTDSDKAAEAVIKLKGAMDLQKGWFLL
jgi:Ca2+-binding RTX toxin-like protein